MELIRQSVLKIGKRELSLPSFFPSISSVKTILKPLDYLQVLETFVGLNNQFLISAFDIASDKNIEEMIKITNSMQEAGCIILMDSGNYESYWKESQSHWRQHDYQRILSSFPYDIAFCFDEQKPPSDIDEHIKLILSHFNKDQAISKECVLVPIIHGSTCDLPSLCVAIGKKTQATILAVPERNLGEGIIERARSLEKIRRELNKFDCYISLHLLGTGNPISIAIYAAMGADSFDGLEWCQTVVDHNTALLYHLSQSDFFMTQTSWGSIDLSFQARTLAHNLEFYSDWMKSLHNALLNNSIIDFCRLNFPTQIFEKCATAFKWE